MMDAITTIYKILYQLVYGRSKLCYYRAPVLSGYPDLITILIMNGQSGGYIQTSSADPPQISILNGPYSKGMVPTTLYFLKLVRFHRSEDWLVRM
ncbi:hypothetical protein DM613_24185 [Escherichia coli]|nr:hypothetical protein [Escherichia coli]